MDDAEAGTMGRSLYMGLSINRSPLAFEKQAVLLNIKRAYNRTAQPVADGKTVIEENEVLHDITFLANFPAGSVSEFLWCGHGQPEVQFSDVTFV